MGFVASWHDHMPDCLLSEVTDDVVVADTMETAHKGEMANW